MAPPAGRLMTVPPARGTTVSEPYDVGFGKPPKRTQFVKGKSGNPSGRPKGSKNLTSIYAKAAREKITLTIGGKTKKMSKIEAAMLQLYTKAAAGDLAAIRLIHGLMATLEVEQGVASETPIEESDAQVMKTLADRIRNSQPPADEEPNDATEEATQ